MINIIRIIEGQINKIQVSGTSDTTDTENYGEKCALEKALEFAKSAKDLGELRYALKEELKRVPLVVNLNGDLTRHEWYGYETGLLWVFEQLDQLDPTDTPPCMGRRSCGGPMKCVDCIKAHAARSSGGDLVERVVREIEAACKEEQDAQYWDEEDAQSGAIPCPIERMENAYRERRAKVREYIDLIFGTDPKEIK